MWPLFEASFCNLTIPPLQKKVFSELGEKIDYSNEKTENFHIEMVRKFDALDVKYGIIGQGLNEMNGRFGRLEGDVREMKDAFLKLVNHMTEE